MVLKAANTVTAITTILFYVVWCITNFSVEGVCVADCGHGSCIDDECKCDIGFIGLDCSIEYSLCPDGDTVCYNGATCIPDGGLTGGGKASYMCDCSNAFRRSIATGLACLGKDGDSVQYCHKSNDRQLESQTVPEKLNIVNIFEKQYIQQQSSVFLPQHHEFLNNKNKRNLVGDADEDGADGDLDGADGDLNGADDGDLDGADGDGDDGGVDDLSSRTETPVDLKTVAPTSSPSLPVTLPRTNAPAPPPKSMAKANDFSFCVNGGTCVAVGDGATPQDHQGCICPDDYSGEFCQYLRGYEPEKSAQIFELRYIVSIAIILALVLISCMVALCACWYCRNKRKRDNALACELAEFRVNDDSNGYEDNPIPTDTDENEDTNATGSNGVQIV